MMCLWVSTVSRAAMLNWTLTKLLADTYGTEGPIKPLSRVVVVRIGQWPTQIKYPNPLGVFLVTRRKYQGSYCSDLVIHGSRVLLEPTRL